ncbi:MAG TPA: radical SAM peptide maturase [Bacteroidales bacterium]|nr:radical SAM peptide maturase [Bacteroidales bacterium]
MKSDDFFYDNETKYFVLQPQDKQQRNKKENYLKSVGFYKEQDKKRKLSGRFNAEHIKDSLANALQVVFEVTENCNLDCTSCGYGELYSGKNSKREKKNLPLVYAINFLDFINKFLNQNLNRSLNKRIAISFYGGEPLLNIEFIKSIVDYVNKIKNENFDPRFAMTTNALLLRKHIAFLAENNFRILVSLDGNKNNNSYRMYPNGKEAFDEIIENIDFVYQNYPEFFRKSVDFNSVIHNKNSVSEAFNFILDRYKKNTKLSELNTSGINEDKKHEFWEKYKNINEDLDQSEDYRFIRDKLSLETPIVGQVSKFIHTYTNNVYQKYIDFFEAPNNTTYLPTGTCIPFSRKIFITTKGKILPCERISDEFSTMGYISESTVAIDYDRITSYMNSIYDKLWDTYCKQCFYADKCMQCIFNLDLNKDKLVCHGYKHESKSTQIIFNYLNALNKERKFYKRLLKEVFYV